MPTSTLNIRPSIDALRIDLPRRAAWRARLWREWCFVRVIARHFLARIGFVAALVLVGGALFQAFEPARHGSFAEAAYHTWTLVFSPPSEEFPASLLGRILHFLVPILGFTVIIESIVDFSLMLRDRRRSERSWCMVMAASLSNHVILVGLGKLGYRTFSLLRRLGEQIVVLERDPQNAFLDEVRAAGFPLFVGDARRDQMLLDANVAGARCVVIVTNDDLANLEIALDARRMHPGIRVVVRMFDQNMADKIRDGFNIHLAMSQSAVAAPAFAMSAIDPGFVNSTIVDDRLIVMLRRTIEASDPLANRTIADVLRDAGLSVVKWRRPGAAERLFPPPETKLAVGDELLLQGPLESAVALPKPGH